MRPSLVSLCCALALGCSEGVIDGGVEGDDSQYGAGGSSTGGVTSSGGQGSGGTPLDGAGGTVGSGGASSGGIGSGGDVGQPGSGGDLGSGGTGGSEEPGEPEGVVGEPIGFAAENGGTTGGRTGDVVTVSTLADLQKYASASEPYVILVSGTITNGSAGARVSVASNKSIVGLGDDAFLSGIGVEIRNSKNVILQNLKMTLVGVSNPGSVNGGDTIVINGTSKNVWIDHCEIYSEDPTVQTNIDKYDGLIDIRDQTGFITVSWSYIHDHHKACLVGAADSDLHDDRKITYHHNHFEKIVKRMPMYRGAVGHFFNNYVHGVPTTEASFVIMNTCLRVERNVYENVKYAIYSSTTSNAGKAERIDNIGGQSRAYPASCTANIPYEYASVLTPVANVKAVVPAGAGVGKL